MDVRILLLTGVHLAGPPPSYIPPTQAQFESNCVRLDIRLEILHYLEDNGVQLQRKDHYQGECNHCWATYMAHARDGFQKHGLSLVEHYATLHARQPQAVFEYLILTYRVNASIFVICDHMLTPTGTANANEDNNCAKDVPFLSSGLRFK